MKKIHSFRLRISFLVFALVLTAFLLFFFMENIIWFSKINTKSGEIFSSNFFLGRFFIAISFSILAGLGAYVFTNNFYESLRYLSHLIQYWSRTLTPLDEKAISLYQDSEVTQIIDFFHKGIISNRQREEDRLIKSIELNNKNIVERLKPFIPEMKLGGLKNLDISVFPNHTSNPNCDFIDVIETQNGYISVIAGFENLEILESIYKNKLQGIFSLVPGLYYAKEEEIFKFIYEAIQQSKIEKLNLSLIYVSNISNHISYVHSQKTPFLILGDNGVNIISSEDDYYDFVTTEKIVLKTVFAAPSYIIFLSDRIHEILETTPQSLIQELETNVLSKPNFKNSKELILQMSLYLDEMGKTKGLRNVLENFAYTVINKF